MSAHLLRKWGKWLDRILEQQLRGLLINQHIFSQLRQSTPPRVGKRQSENLAEWIVQGYVAFSATAIRRMLEEPVKPPKPKLCPKCGHIIVQPKAQHSLSLVILLRDIEQAIDQDPALFTLSGFTKRYTKRDLPAHFAQRDFCQITRSEKARKLSVGRVRRDINALRKVGSPVRRLANKVVAHTSRDRRKIGRTKFKDLEQAVEMLAETYERYQILVGGAWVKPLVPPSAYDVADALKKIWPDPAKEA
jgi:hypothetical protein